MSEVGKVIEIKKASAFKANVDTYLKATLEPDHKAECMLVTKSALTSRDRYETVAAKVGIPWFVIACLHRRESDQNWKACLHNGEAIIGTGKRTTKVPKGRGPFATWEEAALDAFHGEWHAYDWDLGGILEFCERYNGLGYRKHGVQSPYVYDYTTAYTKGMFNRDDHWDPNLKERRAGVAAMLKCFEELGIIKIV
jgi:lysozyme family protein